VLRLNLEGKKEFDPDLGEDTWELFEAIEDSFGVDLGDYHEICGMTVRELADVISRKANYPSGDKCLSAVTFYKLRRAFESLFGVPRKAISPDASVGNLLPLKERNRGWERLQEHLGLTLPRLHFPGWLLLLALVIPPTLLVSLRVFWGVGLTALWIFNISCALYLVTFVSIIPAIDERFPLSRIIPRDCETFGGLTKVILAKNYASFASQHGSSRGSDVLNAVRQLTATQLTMDPEEISPDTRIPHDLNIY
jgi:hypothetical protein